MKRSGLGNFPDRCKYKIGETTDNIQYIICGKSHFGVDKICNYGHADAVAYSYVVGDNSAIGYVIESSLL
jgi:hypothetical protein